MSPDFKDGLRAAAHLLQETAEDFEQIAEQRAKEKMNQTRSFQQETQAFRDKARLLRGSVMRVLDIGGLESISDTAAPPFAGPGRR